MATGRITLSKLEGLEGFLWDEKVCGFGVRKQKRGIFYYVRARSGGRQIMHSIGRHGSPWTVETARAKALELLGTLASGTDPFAQQSQTDATFGIEAERYLTRKQASLAARTYVEVRRHLSDYAAPLHKLPITDIDRRAIAVLLGQVETSSGASSRNRLRSSLLAFWKWAIAEGLCETSPVQGTMKAEENGGRERVLTAEELRKLLAALTDNRFSEIVRLLLLTACRRTEIGCLTWDEIDLPRKLIVLPPSRTKNGRGLELPLSTQAFAIIDRTPRRNSSAFLFSDVNGYKGWDQDKLRLDARLGIAPYVIHDIRRTVATGLAELGTLPHIVEACLNHQSGHKAGVAGTYNRARYEGEMRAALQKWGDHIGHLTSE
jgi:integrase